MTSNEIRRAFIDYFVKKHGHAFVPSSPVVPHDDPTLLFANAGMNQFKPYFLGLEKPAHQRVANSQKCIRAGGKHNDLDDVGRSRRHHTFFEMLGNWSFGDYFKAGAIEMAWDLLTEHWKLDPKRLHVTVYAGNPADNVPPDDEAAELWKKIAGLPDDHIHRFVDDNFWEMGETGPCGPCTEIFIDRTPNADGGREVNGSDPRVMEIWNLVFIQYNRAADRRLSPLPARHVDTGMGLERICQVLQKKEDNYSTDLFSPLFKAIGELSGTSYGGRFPDSNHGSVSGREAEDAALSRDIAYRVIADHIRCLTFALTDGAIPSNEGRGYVLRRILRRAVRFGRQYLGFKQPFMHELIAVVVSTMGEAFPELKADPAAVARQIHDEEESFSRTLDRGLELFASAAEEAQKTNPDRPVISAEHAFKLHDTYGFPIDLTEVIAREKNLTVDIAGYHRLMEDAREKARRGGKLTQQHLSQLSPDAVKQLETLRVAHTDDQYKYTPKPLRATVTAIWNGKIWQQEGIAGEDDQIALITDKTIFYSQMGGQVGDTGVIECDGHGVFEVRETHAVSGWVMHIGFLRSGRLRVGQSATLQVDERRSDIERNHTSTHLTNWALREVLGEHVEQKGSLVDADKFRFDFLQPQPPTTEDLHRIEGLVREMVRRDLPVHTGEVELEKGRAIYGLRAVFGEKYPPMVRVVSIGAEIDALLSNPTDRRWRAHSIEFCGGTHVDKTGRISDVAIYAEESVSKGIRRVAGVTGEAARAAWMQADVVERLIDESRAAAAEKVDAIIAALQQALKEPYLPIAVRRRANEAVAQLLDIKKAESRKSAAEHRQVDQELLGRVIQQAAQVGNTTLIISHLGDGDSEMLREAGELIRKTAGKHSMAILLAAKSQDTDKNGELQPPKINFLAMVSDDLTSKLRAGDWIKQVAKIADGAGGGRPQMAMAGGKNVAAAEDALRHGRKLAEELIG